MTYLRRLLTALTYVALWTGLVAVAVLPSRLDSLSLFGLAFVYVLGVVAIVFSEVNSLVNEQLDEIQPLVEGEGDTGPRPDGRDDADGGTRDEDVVSGGHDAVDRDRDVEPRD